MCRASISFTADLSLKHAFANAHAAGANFEKARLIGSDFTGASLHGAKFDGALLDSRVKLDGATCTSLALPSGRAPPPRRRGLLRALCLGVGKEAIEEAGCSIPFPQQDLRVIPPAESRPG